MKRTTPIGRKPREAYLALLFAGLLSGCGLVGAHHDAAPGAAGTVQAGPLPPGATPTAAPHLKILDSVTNDRATALLAQHCGGCHGPGSAGSGGFLSKMDAASLVAAGVVVPGSPTKSSVFLESESGAMPPGQPLSSSDVALLEA